MTVGGKEEGDEEEVVEVVNCSVEETSLPVVLDFVDDAVILIFGKLLSSTSAGHPTANER